MSSKKLAVEKSSLALEAVSICEIFYSHLPSHPSITSWALSIAKDALQQDVSNLAQAQHGLHFNAKHATSNYLEGSFMKEAASRMSKLVPNLWIFFEDLLGGVSSRRRARADSNVKMWDAEMEEMDLGEFGGDGMDVSNSETDDDPASNDDESKAHSKSKKREHKAAARNAALLAIVSEHSTLSKSKLLILSKKTVVLISILLQSANEKCNYLQSILGIFFHSTSVPEKVIETLAHAGLSVSLTSIHNAVSSLSKEASIKIKRTVRTLTAGFAYDNFDINFKTSQPTIEHQTNFVSATSATVIPLFGVDDPMVLRCSKALWELDPMNPAPSQKPNKFDADDAKLLRELHGSADKKVPGQRMSPRLKRFAWHVRDILVRRGEHFKHLAKYLGEPESVWVIPLHKTEQVPCRAMKIKQSTTDGNIQVVDNLHEQGGIGEAGEKGVLIGWDRDMSEWVILIHGDLLTKERLDAIKASRAIEDTPKRRFQHLIFLPGLFHYKMACADAFWRTWVKPKETHSDVNSVIEHVGVLRPDETGKFATKPGFRRVHDVIHHDLWASMLDCWQLEAKLQNPAWTTLEAFAAAEPSWDLIKKMSEIIVEKYVATTPNLSILRDRPLDQRDCRFENQILRNRDELLYVELCHAMNAGDVGRVESSFVPWSYIFKATGKYKYASQIVKFEQDLKHKYPPELR